MRIYWFFNCTNLNLLHPRMLCGSGEEDLLISSMYFHYFVIISPWKRAGPFIWTKLNLLYIRMLCAKFSWNSLSESGEEDFKISLRYFSLFRNFLPFGKGCGHSFEQTWKPFTQGCIVPSLKLAQWFLRRRFFNFVDVFSLFRN